MTETSDNTETPASAPARFTQTQRLTAQGYSYGVNKKDGLPYRAVDWQRIIRPEWSSFSDPGGNLKADIADIRASGAALADFQIRFVDHVDRFATRRCDDGSLLAMLADC